MPSFFVNSESFFAGIRNVAYAQADRNWLRESEMCAPAMEGIIQRYELRGARILSLGAGYSFEEYAFHRAGCRLWLNDLDAESRALGTFLASLPASSQEDRGSLRYDIEDAAETAMKATGGDLDVLYVSGFHPDEIRREEIQARFVQTRSPAQAAAYITWPHNEEPYLSTLITALGALRGGGLAIYQHYRGGVYVDANPHYLQAVRKQFSANGVELVEIYAFRDSTAHLLIVGFKGTLSDAMTYRLSLEGRSEIRTFHGRYPDEKMKSNVIKVFDLIEPQPFLAIPKSADVLPSVGESVVRTAVARPSFHALRAADYYAGLENPSADTPDTAVGIRNVLLCKASMTQLVERYDIRNRRVLSLGAGQGFEEYWLHAAGCTLVLNDLDENGGLRSYVDALPHPDGPVPDPLVYAYGDASEFLDHIPDQSFDVLYVSSFHPDEIRREEIQEQFRWRGSRRWQRIQGITWPDATEPYLSVLMRAISKVCPGGLVIFQHYRGGVEVDANLHYLDAVAKQLSAHGATLLEIYAFRKRPANTLVVSYRGGRADALEFARKQLACRPALSTFHGRYPYERLKADIVKVYDIGRGGIVARDVYPLSHLCIRAVRRIARMVLRKLRIAQ